MSSPLVQAFRKLAEQRLLSLPDAVLWLDEQGQVLKSNKSAGQLYGYAKTQFRQVTIFDLDNRMDADRWRKDRQSRSAPKKQSGIHRKADGKPLAVEVTSYWEEMNGIWLNCSIIRDLSEQKEKELNLKRLWEQTRQQDRIAQLSQFSVERTQDSVLWLCPQGKIKFVNNAAVERLGYTREELLNMYIVDVNPTFTATVREGVWRQLREQDSVLLESVHVHKSGKKIPVEINTNFVVYGGEEYACSIVRDITERKEREASLEQAVREISRLKEKLEAENQYLHNAIKEQEWSGDIITQSDQMQRVLYQIEQVAPTDSTVLITGESGTGKELAASAIHRFSQRSAEAFIKVNCAALPEHLIESELFGHEKGAFTGAVQRKVGKFELADRGTLFLDEIGELPLGLQAKILRALQEGEIEPLGGKAPVKVDVRIVTATNRNLEEMVKAGTFRNDLFFRLFVFPVLLPPLRERVGDVPLLIRHFCRKYEKRMGKTISSIDPTALRRLEHYAFPGNIRELENIVERGLIMSDDGVFEIGDWLNDGISTSIQTLEDNPVLSLEELQRRHIISVLEKNNWRVSGKGGAAEMLDLPSTTLRSKMLKLGIRRSSKAE